MAHSTHTAVAAILEAELGAQGWCTVETATAEFGLSQTELFALVRDGVIPSMRPRKARLLSRKALIVYMQALYEADPDPAPMARPGQPQSV